MYRLVSWGGSVLILSPQRFSTFPPALDALRVLYPTVRGLCAVVDDHDQPPAKALLLAPPSWTFVDGINAPSWDAGQLSIKEFAGVGVRNADDLQQGPDVVDQGHTLITSPDGWVGVYLDTDEDGIPETLAEGDWQFRFGGVGDFDVPYSDTRNREEAVPGMLVEAEDGDGELATLEAIYPADTAPYPVPLMRPAYANIDTGLELPSATDADGPFQGRDVYTIWHRYPPQGFAVPAPNVPLLKQQAEAQLNVLTDGSRTARIYLARPLTPLPDDDGHRAGYSFKGIRLGYTFADRLFRETLNVGGEVQVFETWQISDPADFATYSPVGISPDLHAVAGDTIVQPGLLPWIVWGPHMGRGTLPAGWDWAGTTPVKTQPLHTDERQTWGYWETGVWAEAVYVYRAADGTEYEYTSPKTTASLTLNSMYTLPMYPKPASVTTSQNGISVTVDYTAPEVFTPYTTGGSGVDRSHFNNGDGAVGVFNAIQGADNYHYLTVKQARPGGGNPSPAPLRQQAGASPAELAYLQLGTVTASPHWQTVMFTSASTLNALGVVGTDFYQATCQQFPIFPPYANGGTWPGRLDTLTFLTFADAPATAAGPRPVYLKRYTYQPPNHFDGGQPLTLTYGGASVNVTALTVGGPDAVGPTTFGAAFAADLGQPPAAPGQASNSELYQGRMTVYLLDPQQPPFKPVADEWRVYNTTSLYTWRAASHKPLTGDPPPDGELLAGYQIEETLSLSAFGIRFPALVGRLPEHIPVLHLYALPVGAKGPVTVYLASDDSATTTPNAEPGFGDALNTTADPIAWHNKAGATVAGPTVGPTDGTDNPFGYIILNGVQLYLYARPQRKGGG